jgi:hypothetical protein
LVVKNGSNIRSIVSGEIPSPLSLREIDTTTPESDWSAGSSLGKVSLAIAMFKTPPRRIASRAFAVMLINASSNSF